jgi:phage terminase small subunit
MAKPKPPLTPRGPKPLSTRQARFAAEYAVDGNGAAAAVRAGYSAAAAPAIATRLLRYAHVREEVARLAAQNIERAGLSAAIVMEAIRRQVEADVRHLFDANGRLRAIHELSAEDAAMIAGFEAVTRDVTPGEKGPPALVLKVKLAPRDRYVEMAAKHFKLLTEVIRVEDENARVASLLRGRDRVAEAAKRRRGAAGDGA